MSTASTLPEYQVVARMLDHSLLQPTATLRELEQAVEVGRRYGVATVCIVPYFVRRAAELLVGSDVEVCTTIGFPHGVIAARAKLREVEIALEDGATELDMVVNLSLVRSGRWIEVQEEIGGVLDACRIRRSRLKVIFEMSALSSQEKLKLLSIAAELGVDWVKTSTGFGAGGATFEDVRLMRERSPASVQVKASGGVRSLDQVLEYRRLGASRVGTSATETILGELRQRLGLPGLGVVGLGPSGY